MSDFRWIQARRRRSPWLGAALAFAVGAGLVVALATLAGCGMPYEVRRSAEVLAQDVAAIQSDFATFREGTARNLDVLEHVLWLQTGDRIGENLGRADRHARLLEEATR